MRAWPTTAGLLAIVLLVGAGGCIDDSTSTASDASAACRADQGSRSTGEPGVDPGRDAAEGGGEASEALPTRGGARRETTGSVPHAQIDAEPIQELDADLRQRVFLLPCVEERESQLSLPGATGFWLVDDVELARPDVLRAGREFGHVHPDGSLHLWMPVERAEEAAAAGWGELHPWVERDNFWNGVLLVFTPESPEEVDLVLQLVLEAYNFVTGAELDTADVE